ncbi:MAG: hypothetical protein J6P07_06555 [Spirochaetaceae bacterium]|nr:hypothetical protein [Spirochaetaceae bacterium]
MDLLDSACDSSRETKRKAKWQNRRDKHRAHDVELKADSDPAAHPLVKDARFLRTAFFPAALPECFEE